MEDDNEQTLTTEQRNAILQASDEANALLQNESLGKTITEIREWLKEQILRTGPEQTQVREAFYLQALGIDLLIDTLQQRVHVGDQLLEMERALNTEQPEAQ